MEDPEPRETERFYRAYQRLIALSFAFSVCQGAYFLMVALDGGGGRSRLGLMVAALYLLGVVALKIHASGARAWGRRDPLLQAVMRDEWSRATRNRASRTAFVVVLWAQVPLAYFMATVPPEPSVGGMGALTMVLGLGTFFGGYLYYGRQPDSG